jgi:hypothetical protein
MNINMQKIEDMLNSIITAYPSIKQLIVVDKNGERILFVKGKTCERILSSDDCAKLVIAWGLFSGFKGLGQELKCFLFMTEKYVVFCKPFLEVLIIGVIDDKSVLNPRNPLFHIISKDKPYHKKNETSILEVNKGLVNRKSDFSHE